jgi:argininosuccinate synthase
MANSKMCVLAYSGGLDTSVITLWLVEQGYDVHAVLVDVGQAEDLEALRLKALTLGAKSALISDARPAIFRHVVDPAIGLAATYEGNYRLGTALTRPFIAAEQVRLARKHGGATLVHGATGKGNDQIRFEFAYRSLAPDCPVLAPWKVWDLRGREDLIAFLKARGHGDGYELTKTYSLDENFWHLSIEGGPLEDARAHVPTRDILAAFADRFAGGVHDQSQPAEISLRFQRGVPIEIDGQAMDRPSLVEQLNRAFRSAPWAWDLVIENRFTGIKSRGLYLNPAAKLLHAAVDALARTTLNKRTYDDYVEAGARLGAMLYRGEFFTDQCRVLLAAAKELMRPLTGTITLALDPVPHAVQIDAADPLFTRQRSTFEHSDFSHQDADGFIRLSWLSSIGRPHREPRDADALETAAAAPSQLRPAQPLPDRGLVPTAV